MELLTASLLPLELSAQIKDEILPIVLFFGMFFAVSGLGGLLIRHVPRKPGSMLDEILNENWDDEDDEEQNADASEQAAAEPVQGEQTDAADGYDRK
ncbi:hypothetical protein [Butyricicoccus sp.]|uniref:hypothetical protein n=1 Tax=Butyricicoccus sp. TaxID=2049021 RepID=UPI003735F6AE